MAVREGALRKNRYPALYIDRVISP